METCRQDVSLNKKELEEIKAVPKSVRPMIPVFSEKGPADVDWSNPVTCTVNNNPVSTGIRYPDFDNSKGSPYS
jgi:hypothetical protein